jgi:hypothetical protein
LRIGQSIEWPLPNGRNRRLRVRSVTCNDGRPPSL